MQCITLKLKKRLNSAQKRRIARVFSDSLRKIIGSSQEEISFIIDGAGGDYQVSHGVVSSGYDKVILENMTHFYARD